MGKAKRKEQENRNIIDTRMDLAIYYEHPILYTNNLQCIAQN